MIEDSMKGKRFHIEHLDMTSVRLDLIFIET